MHPIYYNYIVEVAELTEGLRCESMLLFWEMEKVRKYKVLIVSDNDEKTKCIR